MARIKRFPNPGSDIDMFIYIFKEIYDILSTKPLFSLYDMAIAMINKKLASSGGFIGVKAFTTSLRKDSSHDRLYNQCKMYAELYRSFGWISSSEDKKLIYCITEYLKKLFWEL